MAEITVLLYFMILGIMLGLVSVIPFFRAKRDYERELTKFNSLKRISKGRRKW